MARIGKNEVRVRITGGYYAGLYGYGSPVTGGNKPKLLRSGYFVRLDGEPLVILGGGKSSNHVVWVHESQLYIYEAIEELAEEVQGGRE